LELTETEQALTELTKMDESAIIYKSIGSLLVKAEKAKVTTELTDRKELLNFSYYCLTLFWWIRFK
jgi:prefoldin beta subunit